MTDPVTPPKRRGPKPRPASQKRTEIIRVLLRPDEAKRIRGLAGAFSLSSYLRDRGLAGR